MPKLIRYCLIFIVLATTPIYFNSTVSSQGAAIVKILFLKGSPKIMKAGKTEWRDCKIGMAIDNGDRVKTSKAESVEISFTNDNSNIVRIEGASDVFVRKTEAPYSIELLNGMAMALIKNLPKNSTFEIRTPSGLSGARGTGWSASTDGAKAVFDSFVDSIYVKGIGQSGNEMDGELLVEAGWKTLLDKFQKPSGLEKLSDEDIKGWNDWMKELVERLGGSVSLDRISQIENRIEGLESKKDDVNQARDLNRIEKKLNTGTSSSNSPQR